MTNADRRIGSPEGLDDLDFDKLDGLVPVVAQDADTGAVLMVAFSDREALSASLATGDLHFRSRSRGSLWRKGETSGNVLSVVSLHGDCDADTVLARVRPTGPACHTGDTCCFGAGAEPTWGTSPESESASAGTLARLDATLADRASERPEGSYTARLLDDPNLRLKKLGEESAELVAALARSNVARATEEAADLVYHTLVALRAEGIGLDRLLDSLARREDRG
jgi:phosphoribosyl-ATP pyrophosphohydrolase/phosphoribosyl-AMP cyclohydrolase